MRQRLEYCEGCAFFAAGFLGCGPVVSLMRLLQRHMLRWLQTAGIPTGAVATERHTTHLLGSAQQQDHKCRCRARGVSELAYRRARIGLSIGFCQEDRGVRDVSLMLLRSVYTRAMREREREGVCI